MEKVKKQKVEPTHKVVNRYDEIIFKGSETECKNFVATRVMTYERKLTHIIALKKKIVPKKSEQKVKKQPEVKPKEEPKKTDLENSKTSETK